MSTLLLRSYAYLYKATTSCRRNLMNRFSRTPTCEKLSECHLCQCILTALQEIRVLFMPLLLVSFKIIWSLNNTFFKDRRDRELLACLRISGASHNRPSASSGPNSCNGSCASVISFRLKNAQCRRPANLTAPFELRRMWLHRIDLQKTILVNKNKQGA